MKQLITILFIHVFASHAQNVFQKAFHATNKDQINYLLYENDNLVILGESSSNVDLSNNRILMMECDLNGDTTWTRYYGVSGKMLNSRMVTKGMGNYGISGVIFDPNVNYSADGLFIVTDFIGNLQTAISFGGSDQDGIYDAVMASDTTFIAIGASNSFIVGNTISIYGLKISSTGDTLWTKAFGGSNQDLASSICSTMDNMFAVTGKTTSFGTLYDWSAFLMKLDTDGNVLWHKSYNENGVDISPQSVIETNDGGFLITGTREGLTNQDVYVIKTDMFGELEWSKAIGSMGIESAHQAIETINGDFILSGDFKAPFADSIGFGFFDALILKLDNTGNLEFGKIYGNEKNNYGQTIVSDNYGMYYMGGVTINDTSLTYNSDGYLIKMDSDGVTGCNQKTVTFSNWEPTLNVANNIISSIPTNTTLTNLNILSGGTINAYIFCDGQVGLADVTKEPKQLIHIVDLIGRESKEIPNTTLIYMFSDGTTKKVYRME